MAIKIINGISKSAMSLSFFPSFGFFSVLHNNSNNGNSVGIKYLACTPSIVVFPTSVNDKYIADVINNHNAIRAKRNAIFILLVIIFLSNGVWKATLNINTKLTKYSI